MFEDEPTTENETTYRISDEEAPSDAVVLTVAAVTGTPPTELDPLYEYVDPDCLDAVMGSVAGGSTTSTPVINFRYERCLVTVTPARVRVGGPEV